MMLRFGLVFSFQKQTSSCKPWDFDFRFEGKGLMCMCVCFLISKRKMLEEKRVGYLIVGLRLILKKTPGGAEELRRQS